MLRWSEKSLYRQAAEKRGSVLIVVLWLLFFLGMLAVALKGYIEPQLSAADKLKKRATLFYLARAGIERAILEVKNDDTDLYDIIGDIWNNSEEAFSEVRLGDGTFSIVSQLASEPVSEFNSLTGKPANPLTKYGLVDEESKININKASGEVLKNLFEIAGGVNPEDASGIAAAIIDWRDKDDEPGEGGAEDWYYSKLNPGYHCKNADFEVPEELLLVKGITGEILDKVKDRITVYTQGAVNINTADGLVLRSLGMDEELVDKILRFRGVGLSKNKNIFEDVETIINVLNSSEETLSSTEVNQLNRIMSFGYLTVRSDNFMGYSVGQMDSPSLSGREMEKGEASASISIAFVYDRVNDMIKHWRED